MNIVTLPNPILTTITKMVPKVIPEIINLINDMKTYCVTNGGVGLAAPQIGSSLSLFVADLTPHLEACNIKAFINPKIVRLGGEQVIEIEGCLSIPGKKYKVERSTEVTILHGLGNQKTFTTNDPYVARIIQHEYDHVVGVLINTKGELIEDEIPTPSEVGGTG